MSATRFHGSGVLGGCKIDYTKHRAEGLLIDSTADHVHVSNGIFALGELQQLQQQKAPPTKQPVSQATGFDIVSGASHITLKHLDFVNSRSSATGTDNAQDTHVQNCFFDGEVDVNSGANVSTSEYDSNIFLAGINGGIFLNAADGTFQNNIAYGYCNQGVGTLGNATYSNFILLEGATLTGGQQQQ